MDRTRKFHLEALPCRSCCGEQRRQKFRSFSLESPTTATRAISSRMLSREVRWNRREAVSLRALTKTPYYARLPKLIASAQGLFRLNSTQRRSRDMHRLLFSQHCYG